MTVIKRKARKAAGTMSVQQSKGPATDTREEVEIPQQGGDLDCRVSLGLGTTRKLQADYEMLRLDVRLEVPCSHTPEAIDAAAAFAQKWCEAKVDELEKCYEVG